MKQQQFLLEVMKGGQDTIVVIEKDVIVNCTPDTIGSKGGKRGLIDIEG